MLCGNIVKNAALTLEACRMVNNAGIGGTATAGAVHEMTEDTWDTVM